MAWDAFADTLLPSLNAADITSKTHRISLARDHIRAITKRDVRKGDIKRALKNMAAIQAHLKRVESILEVIFQALADNNVKNKY